MLTGVGGTGKTRLAVEFGRRAAESYADGVWIVQLAPVASPALILTAIGDVWGLRPGEGATLEDVISRFLWAKEMLLVIDNCEHLLDGASAAIRNLLGAAPAIRIVATSRESLGIPGEAMVRVPSLALPEGTRAVEESEAVQLFLDRAQAARSGYAADEQNVADIARICTRIDGIPLGLELAAARLRSMSTAELADRLDASFRILSGSAKTALPRQQTLQATIDWSHDLLKPEESAVFRRLAVFAGGFDLAAVEAVCPGGEVERWSLLDALDSLVDKSLVVPSIDPVRATRYRLLEPIRQYAAEKLDEAGETMEVSTAHAAHYAAFVAEASPHTRGPRQMPWERRLDVDYDNVRASFRTLAEVGDLDRYLDTAFNLFLYWNHLGMHLEGMETTVAGLDAAPPETDPSRLIRAWFTTAALGAEITMPRSVDDARRGLEIAKTMGDPNALGRMELQLGAALRHSTTDPEYLEHLLEGRRLLEANPEPYWWEPVWEEALLNLIYSAYLPAQDERLIEHTETALALFEQVGDEALLAATLGDSAGLWGQVDDAWIVGNLERAVEILDGIEVPYWHGHALYTLGIVRHLANEPEAAAEVLAQGTEHLADCGDLSCWAGASRFLALSEIALGSPEPAAARTAAVIAAMPALPMHEVAKPRTLDVAAAVLNAIGATTQAAIVLGRAAAMELPEPSIIPREPILEATREQVVATLGEAETNRLIAIGAEMDADDGLDLAARHLTAGVE